MRPSLRLTLCLILTLGCCADAAAQIGNFVSVKRINQQLQGRVLEFTHNHGGDHRFYSPILRQCRDVYVYLPPGFDPRRKYPLLLHLHGAFGDEHAFFGTGQIEHLDQLICSGQCPPLVVVCPDGTCYGGNFVSAEHSLWVNGRCGRFEDHAMCELVPWAVRNFSVHPDRRLHAVAGVSAGGFSAMKLALKRRDFFAHAISISGALNLRYQTRCGDYSADFDPRTCLPATQWRPQQVIGKLGPMRLKAKTFVEPVFGSDAAAVVAGVVQENPFDLLDSTRLRPGELSMLVSYGRNDELNFDAQAESFAYAARLRGVPVTLDADAAGNHSSEHFNRAQRRAQRWLGRQLTRQLSIVAAETPTPATKEPTAATVQIARH